MQLPLNPDESPDPGPKLACLPAEVDMPPDDETSPSTMTPDEDGHDAKIKRFVAELEYPLRRYLISHGVPRRETSKLAQAIFLDLFLTMYARDADNASWKVKLVRTTRREIAIRRRRVSTRLGDSWRRHFGRAALAKAFEPHELAEPLSRLGGDELEVVMLSAVLGLSEDELAAVLDCDSDTAKSRLELAKARICELATKQPKNDDGGNR